MIKIKELFNLEKGSLQSSKCTPGEFDFITASKDWKTHNEYSHEQEALIFAAAASGSLGRTHYVNGKFITSDLCFILSPKDERKYPIDFKFYHIIFNTLKDDIVKNTKAGTSKEAIGLKSLGEYQLPYFNIERQKEISNHFFSLAEDTEKHDTELSHQLSLISQLRQAFLREAIQGNLVSNEIKDGATGAQLLAEIQKEKEQLVKEKKIKKQKPLPPISNDEIPFEIPENWAWCRLGEIEKEFLSGNAFKSNLYSKSPTDNYVIRLGNVKNDSINEENNPAYIKDEYAKQSKKYLLIEGDVLITMTGTRGKKDYLYTAIVPRSQNKLFLNQRVGCIRILLANKEFISKLLKASLIIEPIFASSTGAANQANIGVEAINSTLIPLPPLEIQERIVAQLDELMQYCDALEEQVKESRALNEQLLQQVLREALEGGNKKDEEVLPMVAEDTPLYSLNKEHNMSDMAILAGHIINTLSTSNDKDFGRVKLQKMLHLVHFHCNLDAPLQYKKKVAGPYCRDLESQLEQKLKQLRFFDIKKEKIKDYEQVVYTKLASSNELDRLFANEFEHKADEINNLLQKFRSKNTNFCEAVSTMYAVWNNRLLNKEAITDELLKTDFLKWDESKKKFIGKLDDILDWMRKNGVVPVGNGKII